MRGRYGASRTHRSEGEHPGGQKAQESYAPRFGLNSRDVVADRHGDQPPEGEEALGAISTVRSVRDEVTASDGPRSSRRDLGPRSKGAAQMWLRPLTERAEVLESTGLRSR
jgi:hypothetical protein